MFAEVFHMKHACLSALEIKSRVREKRKTRECEKRLN